MKLVIEISLYYDAQSKKHQTIEVRLPWSGILRYVIFYTVLSSYISDPLLNFNIIR